MPILETATQSILFVHVPKTGGSSIEDWLTKHGELYLLASNPRPPFHHSPQHMTWQDIQFLYCNRKWDYTFSIVRDPYSRAESEFAFRHHAQLQNGRQIANFNNWLENHLEAAKKHKFILDNHMRQQSDFLAQEVEVFRFEDGIDKIITEVSTKTGLPLPEAIPHSNKRIGKPSCDWSGELLKSFNEFYAADFELLGYPQRKIKVKTL